MMNAQTALFPPPFIMAAIWL